MMAAEVGIQKFSFPFSCGARQSQQDEVVQRGCIQVKALELLDLQENPLLSQSSPVAVVGASVCNENQARKAPPGGAAQVLVFNEASQSATVSRRCVFQNLTVESEDQRPAAKRQLSSESAARNITVVKKSAVSKEAEEQRHPKPRGPTAAPCAVAAGKRRRRRDLFTNSEVFHRVDSHVIRAGAEVRTRSLQT